MNVVTHNIRMQTALGLGASSMLSILSSLCMMASRAMANQCGYQKILLVCAMCPIDAFSTSNLVGVI